MVARFYQLIAELKAKLDCAIVLVSHDLHVVMSASDRVICLNGHICRVKARQALFQVRLNIAHYLALAQKVPLRLINISTITCTMKPVRRPLGPDHVCRIHDTRIFTGLGVAILTGVLGCFAIWRAWYILAMPCHTLHGRGGCNCAECIVYFGVIALALILSVLLFTLTSRIQGPMLYWAFAQTGLALGLIGRHLGPRIID